MYIILYLYLNLIDFLVIFRHLAQGKKKLRHKNDAESLMSVSLMQLRCGLWLSPLSLGLETADKLGHQVHSACIHPDVSCLNQGRCLLHLLVSLDFPHHSLSPWGSFSRLSAQNRRLWNCAPKCHPNLWYNPWLSEELRAATDNSFKKRTKMPAVVAATPKRLFSATFPSHPFHQFHSSHSCGAPKLLYCYTWHKILRPLMNLCIFRLGSLHIASMFHLHEGLKPSALTKALDEKCTFGTFLIKWKSRIKKARSPNSHGLARNKNSQKALQDSHDSRSHCMLSICRGLASKSSADKQATKTPAMSMTVDNKGPLTLAGSACHGKTWKIARCSGRIVRGYDENWHEIRETVSIKMSEVMLRQFQVITRWWSCCHAKRSARSTPKRWSTRGAEAPKITEKVTWVQSTRQK